MNTLDQKSLAQLRGEILRRTSRSFYLSIRLLPRALRDPIALAYLLARATDTLADTPEISAGVRATELARLAALLQGRSGDESFEQFAMRQGDDAERALIRALPQCLSWLRTLPAADREDLQRVLANINQGQTLDVQRFANPGTVTALATAGELERYTYLVAGCVGEFWTHVCFRHLPNFSHRSRDEMLSLGVAYGKGLQLINILRDAGADLRAGRCYLPLTDLASAGLQPGDLLRYPAQGEAILQARRARAEQGIAAGIEYACAIRPWRARLATVLPALIGARTLALLRNAGPLALEHKVKVPRAEVRLILLKASATLAAPRVLRRLFAQLAA
ncbi:MAG: phytoene/squalene synthase family protein [Chthoniobacterales bacterium]